MIFIGNFSDLERRQKMIEILQTGEEIEVDCENLQQLVDYLKFKGLHGNIKKSKMKDRYQVIPKV